VIVTTAKKSFRKKKSPMGDQDFKKRCLKNREKGGRHLRLGAEGQMCLPAIQGDVSSKIAQTDGKMFKASFSRKIPLSRGFSKGGSKKPLTPRFACVR